ncbi:Fe-S cluster assembly ATPase SufC [Sulfodiicoccus acidiphilus]|uniref:Fe-S cluster assembly ATPase SufC n=1 Tax=Sulfodiicoccus acidiphilus TaxID=1670455 RepID=A0A348B3G4_9CREN|nr:Fe-S cluster assembly ATPase SufC [Sulfodiicoccus acidiphilus]BBD72716.1 Fe-S cluster assembly ATPase SufC [Sulfodiicoccus acidiphilus]GGT95333.1 Fe-S cluster assembly ATPase SufC [Sulfodiicoccus acidiphilus]
MAKLTIEDLHVEVEGKEVIRGINLEIRSGEIHALMGPNGSGKTSLSLALMGHPKYKITKGRILLNDENITNLETHEKVKKGLFLAFQLPVEIPGVKLSTLLLAEYNRIYGYNENAVALLQKVKEVVKKVNLGESLLNRGVHEGFSGGEKKRAEILQMLILRPKFAILDEPDSGVDVDGLKMIGDSINQLLKENGTGYLIITHYRRILDYVKTDVIHVLNRGKLVASGGEELAKLIDEKGYEAVIK